MIIRDKLGWPVEKFVDRPFTNFIRILIHGNIRQTYRKLNKEKKKTNANSLLFSSSFFLFISLSDFDSLTHTYLLVSFKKFNAYIF